MSEKFVAFAEHRPDDTYQSGTEGWKQQWFAIVEKDGREIYSCGPFDVQYDAFHDACRAVAKRRISNLR